jgi:hypothetical protein
MGSTVSRNEIDAFAEVLAKERGKQITAFCRSLPLFPESVRTAKIIFRFDDGQKATCMITGIERVPAEKPTRMDRVRSFLSRHPFAIGLNVGTLWVLLAEHFCR